MQNQKLNFKVKNPFDSFPLHMKYDCAYKGWTYSP